MKNSGKKSQVGLSSVSIFSMRSVLAALLCSKAVLLASNSALASADFELQFFQCDDLATLDIADYQQVSVSWYNVIGHAVNRQLKKKIIIRVAT